jgi:hypothetical protein
VVNGSLCISIRTNRPQLKALSEANSSTAPCTDQPLTVVSGSLYPPSIMDINHGQGSRARRLITTVNGPIVEYHIACSKPTLDYINNESVSREVIFLRNYHVTNSHNSLVISSDIWDGQEQQSVILFDPGY